MFADIQSSNIVGYTAKDAAQGKFIILGAQFEGVASGEVKINDVITGLEGVNIDIDDFTHEKTAPQIQVPATVGYNLYYYVKDGYYETGDYEDGEPVYGQKPGWVGGDGMITEDTITPGVAVWLKSVGADATVTIAGAVSASDEVQIDCPAGFALRANAFPIQTALNGSAMKAVDIVGVDIDIDDFTHEKTAPQIQVPAAVGYELYYYVNDGYYETGDYEDGEPVYGQKAGWVGGDGMIADGVIPAAQGFWTKGVTGSFKLKFTK